MKRICPVCHTEFDGRADKKFCCDQCRNTYNNQLKQEDNSLTYKTNRLLKKNRQILADMYQKIDKPDKERHSVLKDKLVKEGFKFDYMTNIYKTKTDKIYYYCYDYGYYADNDFVVIVRKKEYVD
ncbi:MAG: hypothetical protein J6S84_04195 [Bacteroidales bacterium]|nr:hypothetical protein [Bacteroidales bacterium]